MADLLEVSKINIGNQNYEIKDSPLRASVTNLAQVIDSNNEIIMGDITSLGNRVTALEGVQSVLSVNYAPSSSTGSSLALQSGDTYETSFSKLEKSISDNERVVAASLNDLNDRIDNSSVQPDWEQTTATAKDYIKNKPDLSSFITIETQPNWNETNTSSAAYIQNKPTIPDAQIQADWSQTTTTAKDYIKNKPNIRTDQYGIYIGANSNQFSNSYVGLSDGKNYISLDTGGDAGINITTNDGSDGQISLTASANINLNTAGTNKAYYNNQEIAVKSDIPTVPTTSTSVTQNDTNPVSGGAVYTKFADLIGTAPAALDTLQEIAAALNNDADLAGTLTTQISGKVPKVSNPTTDNFASFNSDGTIKDSGHSHSDYITSVKTINNQTITGTGNVNISGLPVVTSADNGKILMVVNGEWTLVTPSVLYSGSGIPNNAQGNNGDLYMQTN